MNRQIYELDPKTIDNSDVLPVQDDGGTQEAKKITVQSIINQVPPSPSDPTKLNVTDFNVYSGATQTKISDLEATSVIYNTALDAYQLPPTQDGQVQDLGRELFVDVFNPSAILTTSLDPEIFLTTDAYSPIDKVLNTIRPIASDIAAGRTYGLNTVDANVNAQFKITIFGYISGVNTSAWGINTILYVDPLIAGKLTDIKPTSNIYPVARVEVQDALNGALVINTFGAVQESALAPATFNQAWFTGDIATGTTGTFYFVDSKSKGIVGTIIESISVPDNSIVPISQDSVSDNPTTEQVLGSGIYTGQVEFTISNVGGNEKVYCEVYKADTAGVPIDSGILTVPIGDLGVRPMFVMTTALMNADNAYTIFANLSGTLTENVTLLTTERIRYHFLAEKIGSAGGTKTFDIYFGSDHQTFVNIPKALELNDLLDVDVQGAVAGNVLKLNASGLWNGGSINISDIPTLQTELDSKLPLSGGTLEAPIRFDVDDGLGGRREEGSVGVDANNRMTLSSTTTVNIESKGFRLSQFANTGFTGSVLGVLENGFIGLVSVDSEDVIWEDTTAAITSIPDTAEHTIYEVVVNEDVLSGYYAWELTGNLPWWRDVIMRLKINGVTEFTENIDQTDDFQFIFSAPFQSGLSSGDTITLTVQSDVDTYTIYDTGFLRIVKYGQSASVNWGGIGGTLSDQTDLQTELDSKSDKNLAINVQTLDYTVLESDNGKTIECGSPLTLTFPVGLSVGFQCMVLNYSIGTITIAAAGSLQTKDNNTKLASQFTAITAYHRGSDIIVAFGDLSA